MPFIYRQIQDAIFRTIDKPSFSGALPPLSNNAWLKIVDSTRSKDENERLEFLGDALMYATLGRELYKRIPDGDPSIYTETRAALHSNATFSRLAEKLDILGVSRNVLDALTRRTFGEGSSAPLKTRSEIKATGDLFETVIGAYYLEHGFERLCEWVAELYAPLITTAQKAYLEHKPAKKRRLNLTGLRQAEVGSLPKKSRFHPSPIRRGPSKPYAPLSGSVNSRLSAAARSPLVRTSRSVMTPMRKTVVPRTPLMLRITTPKQPTANPKPVYIDLTVLGDSDDDSVDSGVGPASNHKKPGGSSRAQVASNSMLKSARLDTKLLKADSQDSDDERQLERMLLGRAASDMDTSSDTSDTD